MWCRVGRTGLLTVLCATQLTGQIPPVAALKIAGAVLTPLTLTMSELKSLTRTTLRVANPHEGKGETYEGVGLEVLLQKADAPHGEQLRGELMTSYVMAEA